MSRAVFSRGRVQASPPAALPAVVPLEWSAMFLVCLVFFACDFANYPGRRDRKSWSL